MHLSSIRAKNFRLLKDIEVSLDTGTTVIVGRNNSGKTSLGELMRRLLEDTPSATFKLADFSLETYEEFKAALTVYTENKEENSVEAEARAQLPEIEVDFKFLYDTNDDDDLGTLAPFMIDTDPNRREALVAIRYRLKDGEADAFFAELDGLEGRRLSRKLEERIRDHYAIVIETVTPGNDDDRKPMGAPDLKRLLHGAFIYANRPLDDDPKKRPLSLTFRHLHDAARKESAIDDDKRLVDDLTSAVEGVEDKIDEKVKAFRDKLMPDLKGFGYDSWLTQQLTTETQLQVEQLLSDHTNIVYQNEGRPPLPEHYNGLGIRNLIYILFMLHAYLKDYQNSAPQPGTQLIFIEEPEAHLHPQMQELFLKAIDDFAKKQNKDGSRWPVQFVVTTHSAHIANAAAFSQIRYFKPAGDESVVKDLQKKFPDTNDNEFLHKYLTLTRCDLFFADKAILIEGTSERLIIPAFINADNGEQNLKTQYYTLMEVGGAYAHLFFDLLDFLDLPALIITDIDTVKQSKSEKGKTVYTACQVSEGSHTSNATLKTWFKKDVTKDELLAMTEGDKIKNQRRIAYQVSEVEGGPCGRSFEDAFMLANPDFFALDADKLEQSAYNEAKDVKKSTFALCHALGEADRITPRYIAEGLKWLAAIDITENGNG